MNVVVMSQGGRVVVPKEFRQKLGVKEGDEVIWTEIDGQIVLTSRLRQIERAQALCAELFAGQPERSLVDELIAERRADAAREDTEA
jgi:AbrB family looped-hinge helix DNA binding protein